MRRPAPRTSATTKFQVERRLDRGRSSTNARDNKLSAPNKLLAFTDERSAAEQFSAVVHDFSAGQLAQVTRRTKGTAKNWKAGRVFPNGASLINLARNIPEIRAWLYHEIGAEAEFDSPRLADAILNLLNQPEGEALRRALRGAHDRNP